MCAEAAHASCEEGTADMNLQAIEYFVAVGKSLSITTTAEEFYVSQSVLSRHIQNLETELGLQLFERTKPLLTLTEDGKFLLSHATQIMRYVQGMEDYSSKQVKKNSREHVKIGFESHIGVEPLMHFTALAAKQFSGMIEFDFEQADHTILFANLQKGKYDFVFAAFPALNMETFDFETFTISNSGCSAVISTCHPLADRREINLSELKDDSFVIYPRRESQVRADQLVQWCNNAGFSPNIKYFPEEPATYMMYIIANQAVSIVSNNLQKSYRVGVKYIPITEIKDIHIPVGILWRRGDLRPICKKLIDSLA